MEKTYNKYNLLENVIIPASKLDGHPLGANLLNESLLGVKSVFERDKIWSGPERYDAQKFHYVRLQLLQENPLRVSDKSTGLPLVYTWFLTSVDNKFRDLCKIELTKWGSQNITEFVKLLNSVWKTNDPQMKEDLSCIMLGVASITRKDNGDFLNLVKWVLNEIFEINNISKIRNVIVRHSARCVIERAYMFNLVSDEDILKARPPYKVGFEFVSLSTNALKSKRDGLYPIVHDLAWYVIKRSYEGFLDYDGTGVRAPKGKELLNSYSNKYKEEITAYSFAMAYAIEYINDLGLKRSRPEQNGSTEATHGSKSKFATFEEKYTWCAVHEILGYLADNLPYGNYKKPEMVTDYCELVFIPNPAQEIPYEFLKLSSPNSRWLFEKNLLPALLYTANDYKVKIDNWISKKVKINAQLWLTPSFQLIKSCISTPKNKWIVLKSHVSHSEENENGYWALEFNSYLIKQQCFSEILEEPENYLDDLDDLKFRPKSDTYISPKDVVWMYWIEEEEGTSKFGSKDNCFLIESTNTVVHYHSVENGETEYIIPAKQIRNITSISDGDGNIFFNDNNEVIAFCNKIQDEDDYYNKEDVLLIDQDLLAAQLKSIGKKLFWIAKLFRRNAISEKTEKLNYYKENIEQWLVWEEGGEFKMKFIKGKVR